MAMEKIQPGGEEKFARMVGPGQIDQQIRQAIQFLWMVMPTNRKNAEEVEREFRRLVERALKDFREDAAAFGMGG